MVLFDFRFILSFPNPLLGLLILWWISLVFVRSLLQLPEFKMKSFGETGWPQVLEIP